MQSSGNAVVKNQLTSTRFYQSFTSGNNDLPVVTNISQLLIQP
jgi:hypothetical protein